MLWQVPSQARLYAEMAVELKGGGRSQDSGRRPSHAVIAHPIIKPLPHPAPLFHCEPFTNRLRTPAWWDVRRNRLRESLGISADGTEKAFPTTEVDRFIMREAPHITYDLRRPEKNTQHVFLACDPSGGGASAFSICTIAQDTHGFFNVRASPPLPTCHRARPA